MQRDKRSKKIDELLTQETLTAEQIAKAYFPSYKKDIKILLEVFEIIKPQIKTKFIKDNYKKILWDAVVNRAVHNFKQAIKYRGKELYNLNGDHFTKATYKTELNEIEEYQVVRETVIKLSKITSKQLKKLKKSGPRTLLNALAKGQNTLFELTLKISENEIEELKAE